jgi:hypothetical protein
MSDEVYRLREALESYKRTNESLVDKIRELDVADVERKSAKPEVNYALQVARRFVEDTLANPKAVEELRRCAWSDWSRSPGGNFYRYLAPSDGSWPEGEGFTPEAYVRNFHGLNADGRAMAGEPEPKAEEIKLSPEMQAMIARAEAGKL